MLPGAGVRRARDPAQREHSIPRVYLQARDFQQQGTPRATASVAAGRASLLERLGGDDQPVRELACGWIERPATRDQGERFVRGWIQHRGIGRGDELDVHDLEVVLASQLVPNVDV